jgi:hypothetical protein
VLRGTKRYFGVPETGLIRGPATTGSHTNTQRMPPENCLDEARELLYPQEVVDNWIANAATCRGRTRPAVSLKGIWKRTEHWSTPARLSDVNCGIWGKRGNRKHKPPNVFRGIVHSCLDMGGEKVKIAIV